jgi:hypothetical protein
MTTIEDPTYPNHLKTFLYGYDEYQTYDLVCYGAYCDIFSIIRRTFPGLMPFDGGSYLFERFTPFEYDWANDWSTKFFNLVVPFTYVGTVNGIMPDEFSFKNEYKANNSVTLTIPKGNGEKAVITWLEKSGYSGHQYFSDNGEWIKRYLEVTAASDKKDIVISLGEFLICSIVISGDKAIASSLTTQLDGLSMGYLYKHIDTLFRSISSVLSSFFVVTVSQEVEATHEVEIDIDIPPSYKLFTGYVYGPRAGDVSMTWTIERYDGEAKRVSNWIVSTEDVPIPRWLGVHAILYANNNYWNNGTIRDNDTFSTGPFYSYWKNERYGDRIGASFLMGASTETFGGVKSLNLPVLPPGYQSEGMGFEGVVTSLLYGGANSTMGYHSGGGYPRKCVTVAISKSTSVQLQAPEYATEAYYSVDIVVQSVSYDMEKPQVSIINSGGGLFKYWMHWRNRETAEEKMTLGDPTGKTLPNMYLMEDRKPSWEIIRWDSAPAIKVKYKDKVRTIDNGGKADNAGGAQNEIYDSVAQLFLKAYYIAEGGEQNA